MANAEYHERRPLDGAEYLLGDKGCEDTELSRAVWEAHAIKALVPVKQAWKDPQERRPAREKLGKNRKTEKCFRRRP